MPLLVRPAPRGHRPRGGPDLVAAARDRAWEWGHDRRVAFFVWAAILALLVGGMFLTVTALTIGLWLADRNPDTNPVTDLGFFALGAIIATGLVVQLWTPERHIAGVQQAAIGSLALGVAGLIGRRVEPLTGAAILFVAIALLMALHPARSAFFAAGTSLSAPLAALALLAAIPATAYATAMLVRARQAGPSCFLGRCAYGDRFAEMAALVLAIVGVGLLAAARTKGWRVSAWSAGGAAVLSGAAALALPGVAASPGRLAGGLAVAWGIVFVAVAAREARGSTDPPRPVPRG
jgi:hypothetical protein